MTSSIAIVGTRQPTEMQTKYAKLAAELCNKHNIMVCTGGADGIDSVAMQYAQNLKVFLPWDSYNYNKIPPRAIRVVYHREKHADWLASVQQYHPAPNKLSRGMEALHARNYGIVQGCAAVVACPSPQGGGTAQAMRIARAEGIPSITVQGTRWDPDKFTAKLLKALGISRPDGCVSPGKVVHCKKAAYDVYIGRPSKWGNPFVRGKDGDKDEVIAKYKDWVQKQPHLMAALPELEGKVLGCWCAPSPCHGDVLFELLAARASQP